MKKLSAVTLFLSALMLSSACGAPSSEGGSSEREEPTVPSEKSVKITELQDIYGEVHEIQLELADGRAVTCLVHRTTKPAGFHCFDPVAK